MKNRDSKGRFLKGHEITEETRKKIGMANSIALKKFHQDNPEFKKTMNQHFKGKPSWNKGRKHTKEHIENLRLSHIGYKHSKETKNKMRGRISHSKGKTYEELYGEEKAKEKGKQIWELINSNAKKFPRLVGNSVGGGKHSKGVDKKISLAKTGRKFPIEKYPKMGVRKMRDKIKIPKKDTTIEIKIQDYLTVLRIEFVTHKYMNINHSYQCDVFIPSINLVIECDGDYWHGNPEKYPTNKLNKRQREQKIRDDSRTKELLEKGYKVIRIWENEIRKMELEDFKEKLEEVKKNGI